MLTNLRDLGGMTGADGRKIKEKMLIRSDRLGKATDDDIRMLEEIPVTLVVDFRSPMEEEAEPDRAVRGAVNRHLPVVERFETKVTQEDDPDLSTIAKVVEQMVKDETFSFRYFIEFYEQMATMDRCLRTYSEFVRLVYDNAFKGASLWHCTQGKDRAGIGTLIILSMLGVSDEDIRTDYMQTNISTAEEIEQSKVHFMKIFPGVAEKPIYDFVMAKHEYLDTFYKGVNRRFGGMEGYIRDGLGLSDEFTAGFREMFLEKKGSR